MQRWYPEALDEFKIYTVFDLLLEYIEGKKITLDPTVHQMVTTYHDSCNYGRKSEIFFGHGYFAEGRAILNQCCPRFVEMIPNRRQSYCCGAGGGIPTMPFSAEQVYHGRMKASQIKETKAELVVVSCQTCRDQFLKTLNSEFELNIQVKYLWELVADSMIMPEKQISA